MGLGFMLNRSEVKQAFFGSKPFAKIYQGYRLIYPDLPNVSGQHVFKKKLYKSSDYVNFGICVALYDASNDLRDYVAGQRSQELVLNPSYVKINNYGGDIIIVSGRCLLKFNDSKGLLYLLCENYDVEDDMPLGELVSIYVKI